ncbi:MAG: preprotein translocase subunit YajC [Intrasporangium sp.]|uniref:preprotein translocase subunit YajC n=1 Tax=Intrasporangium sp. TaxID=1925024 RepID=UPI0026498A2C|nr:preprotein translocase subunit YajC [Intrasporangium sp.]MDN5796936.1 preprotein translocase subunit YajC [Intrasporangium sp.]
MLNYGNEVTSLVQTMPTQTGSSGGGMSTLLILALPVLLIVWMFWNNSKRQRAMRSFSSSLSIGDDIITNAGIYGTIRHLDDHSAWVEVAEGTTLRIDRRAIAMKQPAATATDRAPGPDAAGPADATGQ